MTDRQVSASLSPALNFPQASPTPCISWIAAQQRVICLHSAGLHPPSSAPANRRPTKISGDEILAVRRALERMMTSFSEWVRCFASDTILTTMHLLQSASPTQPGCSIFLPGARAHARPARSINSRRTPGHLVSQPSSPQPMFGRYELVAHLATGGMAEIFLARERGLAGLERLVVIKRILPKLAGDSSFVDMFLREARIIARLNHPNVIQIFELGEENGNYYIAMEYKIGRAHV